MTARTTSAVGPPPMDYYARVTPPPPSSYKARFEVAHAGRTVLANLTNEDAVQIARLLNEAYLMGLARGKAEGARMATEAGQ